VDNRQYLRNRIREELPVTRQLCSRVLLTRAQPLSRACNCFRLNRPPSVRLHYCLFASREMTLGMEVPPASIEVKIPRMCFILLSKAIFTVTSN